MSIVSIALPLPLTKTFSYLLPTNLTPIIGGRVRVPFGQRQIIGIITAINNDSKIDFNKLKLISNMIDNQPLFSDNLWHTLNWAINYYHQPTGEVLFHALPALLRHGKPVITKPLWQWSATALGYNTLPCNLKKAPKQQQALIMLMQGPIYHHQVNNLHLSKAALKALRIKGLCDLQLQIVKAQNWVARLYINNKQSKLNIDQIAAVKAICSKKNQFFAWLLLGVTGSGKTEVYLKVTESILTKGQQALVLVPEIGLIPQIITSFRERFKAPILVLHSKLNNNEQLEVWLKAWRNECAIVIGTRSAIFTPFARLGIIIIDEEHNNSYKQHKRWCYHARDLAVLRAQQEKISIVLGTATPSIETLYNVKQKKYHQLTLSIRTNKTQPVIHQLLDVKGLPMINGLSTLLINKMHLHLKANNQVMLFLNRRGFAPILLCHECGWITKCQRCDRYHTLHKHQGQVRCHYCNNRHILPHQCSQCGSTQLFTVGLGTEQLEAILKPLFPDVPITRIDRDTTLCKGALKTLLAHIQRGGAHILIGTQILTKGHHFPDVTLVSLLEIDSALFSSDFRAIEHFAQLYTQVIGLAGLGHKKGEILLQTHYPKHPLLQTLLHDGYIHFANQVMEERRQACLPPFVHHILFRATDNDNYQAKIFLDQLRQLLETDFINDNTACLIAGPIPAPIPKRGGRFHWQLLLSHYSRLALQQIVSNKLPLVNTLPQARKVKWLIDVDPINN